MNKSKIDEIAKLLLEGKTCENCKHYNSDYRCMKFVNEYHAEHGVCKDWNNEPIPFLTNKEVEKIIKSVLNKWK